VSADRRSAHLARNLAIAVGVVVAGFVALLATRGPIGDGFVRSPLLGREAPAFEGTSLLGGGDVSLASLQSGGKYVLVNFFGSYCVPCRTEHPELVAIRKAHPDDVAIVSVTFGDENVDDASDFFTKNGGDWPLIDVPRVAVDYGVAKIPETFIVDPDGIVISKASGPITAKRFERLLAEAKAERA
jgi:cytochrome c biogenesis protein CcmG, thiol:disulfide interchange protein DsbE